jgi:hypothetical protein
VFIPVKEYERVTLFVMQLVSIALAGASPENQQFVKEALLTEEPDLKTGELPWKMQFVHSNPNCCVSSIHAPALLL